MVVEKFIGANNLQFEIVECDDTHIPDIKEFCSKVDIENNSTLKSIKFGKWGALEKWWAVYHKNKLMTIYKHNKLSKVSQGDFVKSGEVIALSGNTGELTSGPHLHFELWDDKGPINPEDIISF